MELNISTFDYESIFRVYLKMINIKQYILTDREIDVLDMLMKKNSDYKILGLKQSNYLGLLKSLEKKGFLIKKDDYELHPKLYSFVNYVNSKEKIDLKFRFEKL